MSYLPSIPHVYRPQVLSKDLLFTILHYPETALHPYSKVSELKIIATNNIQSKT